MIKELTNTELICPNCEGDGVYGDNSLCGLCNGTGDMSGVPLNDSRARAILKAARENNSGFIADGSREKSFYSPTWYNKKWHPFRYAYYCASEFSFNNEDMCDLFLSEPRVTEALDFIFRKEQ